MVAISPTVTNSVTFSVLLPSSNACISSSERWRCESRLSLLYFAALDLFPFPWRRSKVSLIWFFTSSSVGSTFWTIAGRFPFWKPPGLLPVLFGPKAFPPPVAFGLASPGFGGIRFLLFLFAFALFAPAALFAGVPGLFASFLNSSFFFFGLLNCDKSITCPVNVAPDNFWYCVVNFSSTGCSAACSEGFSAGFSVAFSIGLLSLFGVSTTGFSTATSTGFSSFFTGEIFGVSATTGFGSKSILPTCFGAVTTAFALINSKRWRSSSCLRLSSISFSLSIRSASFSFLISSLMPFEASLLPLSPANWPQRMLYTSSEIFVFGLASIAIPLSFR